MIKIIDKREAELTDYEKQYFPYSEAPDTPRKNVKTIKLKVSDKRHYDFRKGAAGDDEPAADPTDDAPDDVDVTDIDDPDAGPEDIPDDTGDDTGADDTTDIDDPDAGPEDIPDDTGDDTGTDDTGDIDDPDAGPEDMPDDGGDETGDDTGDDSDIVTDDNEDISEDNTGDDTGDDGGDDTGDDGDVVTDDNEDISADDTGDDAGDGQDQNGDDQGDDTGDDGEDGQDDNSSDDKIHKQNLYKKFMNLHTAVDGYTHKLSSMIGVDNETNEMYTSICKRLQELQDMLYDYMVLKFKKNDYLQSMLFYQRSIATVNMCLDALASLTEAIHKDDKSYKKPADSKK